jgi:hypothetical protein
MCGLCGILGGREHWADAAPAVGETAGAGRRARFERVRLVNRVLAYYGLRLDDWQASAFLLSNRTGHTAIVGDLAALWPAAQRMIGRRLDPLDPALLDALDPEARHG